MSQSENINELASALSKAQGEITAALEDKVNPHFKASYASLSSVWEACRSQLSKNGLAIIQTMQNEGEQLMLITTLTHSSGQWIKSYLPISTVKATPQALGSAITYMRRYSLAAMVGVAPDEDDDANAAMPVKSTIKIEAKSTIVKGDGFDAFVKAHNLSDEDSEKSLYMREICSKSGKTATQVINSALLNEDKFLQAFSKWKKEKDEQESS